MKFWGRKTAIIQTVKKPVFASWKDMGNEAFSEWNPPCGRQSRRLANTPPYGKAGFARSRKRVGFKAFCGSSERHSTAQQSPFGAVREANCLERAPLCRQFLKKASYSRHSPLPPQPEPFWHAVQNIAASACSVIKVKNAFGADENCQCFWRNIKFLFQFADVYCSISSFGIF